MFGRFTTQNEISATLPVNDAMAGFLGALVMDPPLRVIADAPAIPVGGTKMSLLDIMALLLTAKPKGWAPIMSSILKGMLSDKHSMTVLGEAYHRRIDKYTGKHEITLTATKACGKCKGSGEAQAWVKGKYIMDICTYCGGTGQSKAPDYGALLLAVCSTRGAKTKGNLVFRKAKPVENEWASTEAARTYFVWRMARFHGGADVTMPMMAGDAVRHDPYQEELDLFAQLVAKLVFSTNMGGTARWGAALGHIGYDEAAQLTGGLATATSGGPVHDGNKPEDELLEMH